MGFCRHCLLLEKPLPLGPAVTRSKKKRKKTEPKMEEVSQDKELATWYHAGDLGYAKDTTLGRMTKSRKTGYLGTGVYFCSGKKGLKRLADGAEYMDRPIWEVKASSLEKSDGMLKLKTKDDVKSISSVSKEINDLCRDYIKKKNYKKIEQELDEAQYGFFEKKSFDFQDVFDRTYTEDDKSYRKRLWSVCKNLSDILHKYWDDKGKKMVYDDIARKVLKDIQKNLWGIIQMTKSLEESEWNHQDTYRETLFTRILKAWNFTGIDVSAVDSCNNIEFGTVYYTKKLDPKKIATQIPKAHVAKKKDRPRRKIAMSRKSYKKPSSHPRVRKGRSIFVASGSGTDSSSEESEASFISEKRPRNSSTLEREDPSTPAINPPDTITNNPSKSHTEDVDNFALSKVEGKSEDERAKIVPTTGFFPKFSKEDVILSDWEESDEEQYEELQAKIESSKLSYSSSDFVAQV